MSKTTAVAYASSASMVIAGFTVQDWALALGVVCTVTTCVVNWYYKRKKTNHEIEFLKAQLNKNCVN